MKIEENAVILSVLPIHHHAYCLSMDILKRIFGGKYNLYQRFAHARGEKYTIVPTADHADGSADDRKPC